MVGTGSYPTTCGQAAGRVRGVEHEPVPTRGWDEAVVFRSLITVRTRTRILATMLRRVLTTGFVLLGLSVIVNPYGVRLQTSSENFAAFGRNQLMGMGGRGHGADISSLQYVWPVALNGRLLIVAVFTAGVWLIRIMARSCQDLGLVVSGCFACGCLLGALMAVGQAGQSAYRGSLTLAVGYRTAAAGLTVRGIGAVVNCLIFWDEVPALTATTLADDTARIRALETPDRDASEGIGR